MSAPRWLRGARSALASASATLRAAAPAAYAPALPAQRASASTRLTAAWRPAPAPAATPRGFAACAAGDAPGLVDCLKRELEHEKADEAPPPPQPPSPWQYSPDAAEVSSDVVVTREFGSSETVTVTIDVNPHEDGGEGDAYHEDGEDNEESESGSHRLQFSVEVEKPAGSLSFMCSTYGEEVYIDGVQCATKENEMSGYGGPNFTELDEDLVQGFYDYLAERGVDADFASWVRTTHDHHEQEEYVDWLIDVHDFVSEEKFQG